MRASLRVQGARRRRLRRECRAVPLCLVLCGISKCPSHTVEQAALVASLGRLVSILPQRLCDKCICHVTHVVTHVSMHVYMCTFVRCACSCEHANAWKLVRLCRVGETVKGKHTIGQCGSGSCVYSFQPTAKDMDAKKPLLV
jgi:hypothetical protein